MASWAVELETSEQYGDPVGIMLTFYNGQNNPKLLNNFLKCVTSLMLHSSSFINLHVITDKFGKRFIQESVSAGLLNNSNFQVTFYDKEEIAARTSELLGAQFYKHFRRSERAQYGHDLYFTSIVSHKIFPNISRLIFLDVDLKFRADVKQLHNLFDQFNEEHIIGLALEQQPVYLNIFSTYRDANPSTHLGSPPPDGFSGFNSGVLLAHMDNMRNSLQYNSLLNVSTIDALAKKYAFKGHLGDQDFYTLIAAEHPQLFYRLPCAWNVQLCKWWLRVYGADIFDKYRKCDMDVKVYHGNCNSPIPDE
ncbi:Glyco transf 8 domain containing protein [Trichuris trichiura]|uniref:Glyco transf 8 domain containing protein n=1 Tax=Trichuris trichiura TaxID=36087 RepID=A0A077ZAE5_TRITR|nr:Glyco transf 8 domain containing protein [Trichuris trichiura]